MTATAIPNGTPADPQSSNGDGNPDRSGRSIFAPFRWLRRKFSDLLSWVKRRLRTPGRLFRAFRRPLQRALAKLAERLPAPLRWLFGILAPGQGRSFGNRWLLATIAVAAALGLLVAILLSPVAAIVALPVVAIWGLVRLLRRRRDGDSDGEGDGDGAPAPTPARDQSRRTRASRLGALGDGGPASPAPAGVA